MRGRAIGAAWGVVALVSMKGPAAQAPAPDPPYVVRGHQVEARQREFSERLTRFHDALADRLRRDAPDLLAKLEPPPEVKTGYQLLPRIVPEAPPKPPDKPQVISYSWTWSETLMARQNEALDRLESDVAKVPTASPAQSRSAYDAIVTGYRKVVDDKRLIDSDVDYNWLWQKGITNDRAGFDRATTLLDAIRDRQARDEPLTTDILAQTGSVAAQTFVQIEPSSSQGRTVTVRMHTDITDGAFVDAFKTAVENVWQLRIGGDQFRVRLIIDVLPPETLYCGRPAASEAKPCAPPEKGKAIELAEHLARFPKDAAVLTTGAASTHVNGLRAIILSPHDIAPRTLAHEFGHVLGFRDGYVRGYRDIGADGYRIMELVLDPADIMSSPGTGAVLPHHFERLGVAFAVQSFMNAGLEALYTRNEPIEAAARFRDVLERNPVHYGATLQLAKALDKAGKPGEALPQWKRILEMAEAARDADTIRVARARLSDRN